MRKPKQRQRGDYRLTDLQRRGRCRNTRPLVLMVCEGQETEPRYLRALFRDLRLPNPVVVGGDVCGTAPTSIVAYAAEHAGDDDYAAVWCVFDCDEHLRVSDARQRAQDKGFEVAYSNPCIEIWYLLHFGYSTRPRTRAQAIRECGKQMGSYSKSECVYARLRESQDDAIDR